MSFQRVLLAFAGSILPWMAYGCTAQALAAIPTPAHWKLTDVPQGPVSPGATFLLKLSARIQPGWHIYALEEPEDGPIPTQIGLAEGDPLTLLTVEEPPPRRVPDPVLRRATGMFEDEVSFTLHLRCPRTLAPGAVSHIVVRYQSCNARVCLPPHTETLAFPLNTRR